MYLSISVEPIEIATSQELGFPFVSFYNSKSIIFMHFGVAPLKVIFILGVQILVEGFLSMELYSLVLSFEFISYLVVFML
jgi:hypothetical protein